MNTLNCVLDSQTFLEAILIGVITFIIGKISITMILNNDDDEDNKKKMNHSFDLIFFITGFLLHYIIEIGGLNKWYCDKKCVSVFANVFK